MQIQETYHQVKELVNSAQKVLLATRANPTPDGVCSLLILAAYLKNCEKEVSLLAEGFNTGQYQYLPQVDQIQPSLPPQNLVIAIDLSNSPIEKINYETKGDRLELLLTPKKGLIDPKGVEFVQTGLNTNLIITVDTQSLEALGQVAQSYQDTLANLPLINIDTNPVNGLYGKINWIDSNCVSVTEMLFDFLAQEKLDISKEIALYILAGLYFKTFGFRKSVTPKVFQLATKLLQQGANYDLVVKNVAVVHLPEASADTQVEAPSERTQAYIR